MKVYVAGHRGMVGGAILRAHGDAKTPRNLMILSAVFNGLLDPLFVSETKLLDLQVVLERISKLPQATIAKIEGFARGGGHARLPVHPCEPPNSRRSQRISDTRYSRRRASMDSMPMELATSSAKAAVSISRAIDSGTPRLRR